MSQSHPTCFEQRHCQIYQYIVVSIVQSVDCYTFYLCVSKDPNDYSRSESSPMLSGHRRIYNVSQDSAIGFLGAMRIPGVIEYSLSLFFAKLVSYTFLYWLPLYIADSSEYPQRHYYDFVVISLRSSCSYLWYKLQCIFVDFVRRRRYSRRYSGWNTLRLHRHERCNVRYYVCTYISHGESLFPKLMILFRRHYSVEK